MATHRCGTCFFFQEAGFAGNGWCLHADRAKSADVRTLVRRNELACRNDWGQSLWTDPKEAAETGAARKLITAQAERPATEGEIGFMVNPRDGHADARPRADRMDRPAEDASDGEDVVVGQITVMPPGMTGRRRLVDQVPVELPPREPFNVRMAAEALPDTAAPLDPILARPGRSIAAPPEREPAGQTLPGRDRTRPQRVQPRTPDRGASDAHAFAGDRRDAAVSPSTGEQPLRRRERMEPDSPRRSVQHHDEGRFAHAEEAADRSASARPVMASPDGLTHDTGREPAGNGRELPRGVRPAPIPGPVPSRELRGERDSGPRPVLSTEPRRESAPRAARPDESDHDRRPSRPMPAPILDESGTLSVGPPARGQPTRRPALPDLSDDFFTRGVIDPVPSPAGRVHHPSSDEHPDRRSATRPMSDSPSIATSFGTDPGPSEARPGRARPAVPRLGAERDRQPTMAAPVPTVAEANREDWSPPAARPAQRSAVAAPPRPDTGWAAPRPATNQPVRGGAQRPVMATDAVMPDEAREPDRFEPPIPLRPQPADFGEYGGWFDLQSVEPRLAPDLQRACETCRDFRPSENGERGWCTNRDAFTLRTVVNATDLPCISSFGCWWVPFDDIWLSEAAIRGHRNPTPLLDQTLGPEEDVPAVARQRRGSR